jgi:hypothetical protein
MLGGGKRPHEGFGAGAMFSTRQEFQFQGRGINNCAAARLACPAAIIGAISTFELPPALAVLATQIADCKLSDTVPVNARPATS